MHWAGLRCPSHVRFTPNSGHEMAIRDLRSLSVALEPKMSALPPKADIRGANRNVRFVPEADIAPSFDHFVGEQQEGSGNREAERLGRFKIDDEFKFGR